MSYYDEHEDSYRESPWRYWSSKRRKIKNDPTKHYPNKNEAKMLRKLKAKTGLSEEEIRKHKKYRIMLSDTQKFGSNKKWNYFKRKERIFKYLLKEACKELALAKEHPKTIEKIIELNKIRNRGCFSTSAKLDDGELKHLINKHIKANND